MRNQKLTGKKLNHVDFLLGGMGAGNICISGNGCLGGFSIWNKPGLENIPYVYAAVSLCGEEKKLKLLEGATPYERVNKFKRATTPYGLPRFRECEFSYEFPFSYIKLTDEKMPLEINITAWSPFDPPNEDNSSYPMAFLDYELVNTSDKTVEGIYYFNVINSHLMNKNGEGYVYKYGKGMVMYQPPEESDPSVEGAFSVSIDDPMTKVNTALFRGERFDTVTALVNTMLECKNEDKSYPKNDKGNRPGGILSLAFSLSPGESKRVGVRCCWYVPYSNEFYGPKETDRGEGNYRPWYTGQFDNIEKLTDFMNGNADMLYKASRLFADTFYSMTLPKEIIDAAGANLSILKSPTVLRQQDGRMWAWEGCDENSGSCNGSCTHVWNYAQALSHLFPGSERSLRETEFFISQDADGHQNFRTALPIRPTDHEFHPAADGQLGGIIKLYREFTISGDIEFLRKCYQKAKESLDYCINFWDPGREGAVIQPHHNTYDIEFWGPDGMCTSIYLGALTAFVKIGELLNEDVFEYEELRKKAVEYMENKLYNGEYFIQNVVSEGLNDNTRFVSCEKNEVLSPESIELIHKEGPKYQYGKGCLSDGIIGAWFAKEAGLGDILDKEKISNHLTSVYKYNFKEDLTDHINPQRPTFAFGDEGGLILCSWPKGERPALPFIYSDEVWTGVEYQVASHLIFMGHIEEGLSIVRACRERYNGEKRNPFDEIECGHWYARALSSYSLIEAYTGIRYDAFEKTLYYKPQTDKPFTSFLCTETGYALCRYDGDNMSIDVIKGNIEIKEIKRL